MITAAIMTFVSGFFGWLLGIVPGTWGGPPSGLATDNVFHTILSDAASMNTWLPVGTGVIFMVAIVGANVAGLVIKMVRMVLSYLTLGGGAT